MEPQRGVRLKPRASARQELRDRRPEHAALSQHSHNLFRLPQHVFCVGGEGQGEGG